MGARELAPAAEARFVRQPHSCTITQSCLRSSDFCSLAWSSSFAHGLPTLRMAISAPRSTPVRGRQLSLCWWTPGRRNANWAGASSRLRARHAASCGSWGRCGKGLPNQRLQLSGAAKQGAVALGRTPTARSGRTTRLKLGPSPTAVSEGSMRRRRTKKLFQRIRGRQGGRLSVPSPAGSLEYWLDSLWAQSPPTTL